MELRELPLEKNPKKVPRGWVRIPLAWASKAPWNYKEDDDEKAKKLTANIKRNGQVQNIIIRDLGAGKFEIANGNHRLDSFQELKIKYATCFNLGPVSQAAAERVAVETNEQSFDADPVKLGKVIEHIMEEFPKVELLETMPYSEVDFDALIAAGGFDPSQINERDGQDFDEAGVPIKGVPVGKFFEAIGIRAIPSGEAEELAAHLKQALVASKLEKADLWRILFLIKVVEEAPAKTKVKKK